jgi:hypothetical protein
VPAPDRSSGPATERGAPAAGAVNYPSNSIP